MCIQHVIWILFSQFTINATVTVLQKKLLLKLLLVKVKLEKVNYILSGTLTLNWPVWRWWPVWCHALTACLEQYEKPSSPPTPGLDGHPRCAAHSSSKTLAPEVETKKASFRKAQKRLVSSAVSLLEWLTCRTMGSMEVNLVSSLYRYSMEHLSIRILGFLM